MLFSLVVTAPRIASILSLSAISAGYYEEYLSSPSTRNNIYKIYKIRFSCCPFSPRDPALWGGATAGTLLLYFLRVKCPNPTVGNPVLVEAPIHP